MGGLINSIANLGGGSNQYQAKAPTISYQAQKANTANTNYGGAIAGATGNYNAATAGQNGLIGQLQTAAAGGGPNPALAQLQQTTAANVNNAAGAAASARGVNPALAARMAVDSAAGANQTAAGQAATLSAQQQIAARDQLAGVLGTQAGTAVQALGTAGGLQGQQNATEVQNTLGTAGINAGVATANAANDLAAQRINAGVAEQNTQIGSQMFGGLLQGGGAALAALAHGGEVPEAGKKTDQDLAREVHAKRHPKQEPKAAGKKLSDKELAAQVTVQRYFKSAPKHALGAIIGAGMQGFGQGLSGVSTFPPAAPAPAAPAGPAAALSQPLADTGAAPISTSPASSVPYYLAAPGVTSAPAPVDAKGAGPASMIGKLMGGLGGSLAKPSGQKFTPTYANGGGVRPVFYSDGSPEVVPGRANVAEGVDSTRADKVPAWLSPGEGVLPRSVMQAPDAPEKARSFVAHLVKSRGHAGGYRRVAEAKKRARA